MYEFRMPSLGADMEAGILVDWLIKPGDPVKRGQVAAVVETQKGAVDVEIWESGIVDKLVVETGSKVPVGEILAFVRAPDESVAKTAQTFGKPEIPHVEAGPGHPTVELPTSRMAPVSAAASAEGETRVRVSPSARKLAEELGVDIASVRPAEPGGVVSREDVELAAQVRKPAPKEKGAGWQAKMRSAIAAAMSRSKREIPHYYLATDIDVTAVTGWLDAENLKRSVTERLLPVVPFMKAVALALHEVPELNGFWVDGKFQSSSTVHLGMAIAMRGGGLVAPAIHDADKKRLDELMSDLRDLITRVRSGRLRSSELSDPTITFTSLGEQGVKGVFGVIYPPQVAIIGLGKVTERPWIENGAVVVRKIATATLSADHRASDGHRGGLFLAALDRLLQKPEQLQ
ncbi:branched-chain alpha-keto acid dehydrogenase subunit E2 [Nitrosospira lacus]|uniref:Dihydrolipoamide acetyltransferase component of pyruvate dehydrogenase complex n=1 Tax=Nitrosospira lacus TaxID=1288494 RepID=A0A1W6SSW7_9PROT|nr:dihydrolipoamide acetyltransferase family protein [Nitrosospira lacus]ARO88865.1 branched-chain alpha-keto acid dehydrogenase subunit E2 [Nitrosospira lacus]